MAGEKILRSLHRATIPSPKAPTTSTSLGMGVLHKEKTVGRPSIGPLKSPEGSIIQDPTSMTEIQLIHQQHLTLQLLASFLMALY